MLLINNAESAAAPAAVTGANSGGTDADAFASVTIGTLSKITFDSAVFMHGSQSFKFLNGTTVQSMFFDWTLGATFTQLYGAFYFNAAAAAGSTVRLLKFMNGSTVLAELGYASGTNNFQWRTAADAAITGGTSALSVNTWYRCEWDITLGSATAGVANLTAYAGDSLTGIATPTHNVTAQNFGTVGATHVQIGNTGANYVISQAFYLDDLNINDTARPGVGPYTHGTGSTPISGTDTGSDTELLGLVAFPIGIDANAALTDVASEIVKETATDSGTTADSTSEVASASTSDAATSTESAGVSLIFQYQRPSADVAATWTPTPGTPTTLYDKLNETTPDDANYISSVAV